MRSADGDGIGPVQRRALLSSFVGWMFDGFETSTLILVGSAAASSLLAAPSAGDVRLAVGTALSGTLAGWAVGGIVGSVLADYVGRKRMLMVSIAGYCAFTALTAASPSMTALIALRFVTGLFLGSEWSTGTALVAETWPASARAKALGVMQSGYGVGFFLASALWLVLQASTGPEGWRWMFAVGVLPAIALVFIRRGVPESELWLKTVADRGADRRLTLVEVLADAQARGRAVATLVMAAVTVAVFYALTALTGPYIGAIAAKAGLNAGSWASISALVYNAGAILGYVSAGFIADAIGRKPYMACTFVGAIVAGLLMSLAPQTLGASLACVFVLGFFTLGVFSWMPIYLPELFPTRVRATASGFVFNLARLVAFPLPILTAFLFTQFGGYQATVLVLTLLYLLALTMLPLLPETKGAPLPA